MERETKSAVKSLGVWGSTTALIAVGYKLIEAVSNIPPELITDTQAFLIGTFGAFMALVGRWRAVVPVSLFGGAKKK